MICEWDGEPGNSRDVMGAFRTPSVFQGTACIYWKDQDEESSVHSPAWPRKVIRPLLCQQALATLSSAGQPNVGGSRTISGENRLLVSSKSLIEMSAELR